jgi:hypothetical protein
MYDEELEKKKTKGDSVWTESSGVPVPQEPDMGSSPAPKKPVRKAGGGSVSSASKRADGIAQRGKTRGTMIAMCGGGMYKK